MSQSSHRPRKRNAQQMLFSRALFALNKNDNRSVHNDRLSPPPKRQRVVIDESKESKESKQSKQSNQGSNQFQRSRPSDSDSFHSFCKPPPRDSNNFLFDSRRRNYNNHNNNNHNNNNHNNHNHNNNNNNYSIRHTPNTRSYGDRKNINITTRKYQKNEDNVQQQEEEENNNNNNDHNNMSYEKIEKCRMKKLWTDFTTNSIYSNSESIFSSLSFCRDTSFFITSNSIAHKISIIIKLLLTEYFINQNIKFTDNTSIKILDGLSCIGGNTYSFSKIFKSLKHEIYANELSKTRYDALKHNMKLFENYNIINNYKDGKQSRFHFYNLDFLKLHDFLGINICNSMDVIFLDPEWNKGDDYKQTNRGLIHLFDIGSLHLHQVINNIINEWYKNIKIIAIKVAKNYDQQFILRKLMKCKQIENRQFRIGQISFHNQKLIIICKSFHDIHDNQDIDIQPLGLSFDEIFNSLPKLINKNNSNNVRDAISVKTLS